MSPLTCLTTLRRDRGREEGAEMSHRTDDYYEHVSLPWWLVAMLLALALFLAACGESACGCPFGHVCQPMPGKEGFACVPAPRLGDLAPEVGE